MLRVWGQCREVREGCTRCRQAGREADGTHRAGAIGMKRRDFVLDREQGGPIDRQNHAGSGWEGRRTGQRVSLMPGIGLGTPG
jgi:hypothetical protein